MITQNFVPGILFRRRPAPYIDFTVFAILSRAINAEACPTVFDFESLPLRQKSNFQ